MNVINHAVFLAELERYPWGNLLYTRGWLILLPEPSVVCCSFGGMCAID